MIYDLLKPLLFSLEAERAHDLVFAGLKIAGASPKLKEILSDGFRFEHPALEQDLLGMHFPNPVGLAAGFDKNAEIFSLMPAFGFGFTECGTVTALAQPGNPKPRMFRLKSQGALINKLGFNNRGADWVEEHLKNGPKPSCPLGLNIGKSKAVELDRAAEDYVYSFQKLAPFADYVAVNVSSPNTPRLRELQKNMEPLLAALQAQNKKWALKSGKPPKPLFVKVAPDLDPEDLDGLAQACANYALSGIIATNTTLSREGVVLPHPFEGGLSGRPLMQKSTEFVRTLYKKYGKTLTIVGVGGISSAEDAYQKIKAGASLVQLYTGWIYGGPGLAGEINRGLVRLLEKDGFTNIRQAIGAEA